MWNFPDGWAAEAGRARGALGEPEVRRLPAVRCFAVPPGVLLHILMPEYELIRRLLLFFEAANVALIATANRF